MGQNNDEEASTLELIALITGLILFLWSIFSIFYDFIANRTRRFILRALAWWIVFILEANALMLLYDRVLNPLKDGVWRWPAIPDTMINVGIAYVVVYIIAMWDTARVNKRESSVNG